MTNITDDPPGDADRGAVESLADITDDDAYDVIDEEDSGATRGGGGKYLTDLADVLRAAGLNVKEYDGWQRRARGSGGLSPGPLGIIVHHTASGRSSNGQRDADFIAKNHKHSPISNLYLDREGTWWVLAAGGTNTNGRGGPLGPIRKNGANSQVIGIEAGNNGTGEPWPIAQQDSYVAGVAALAERYGISTSNVSSHQEWTPGRKIDPAGPSRFGSINRVHTWDMDKFRAEVSAKRNEPSSAPASAASGRADVSGVSVHVIRAGDTWWAIAKKTMGDPAKTWEPLAAANGGKDRVLLVGGVVTIPAGAGGAATDSGASTGVAEFPGEAKRGMAGLVVLAWQEALIAHGVISDTPGNRDSDYGTGTETAVLQVQQSWGWSNADGIAGSGTWKRLHGAS